tara:strand:+ start:543 stop:893 length:351 start_codon:yes stop_codon:yes gene_type:complete
MSPTKKERRLNMPSHEEVIEYMKKEALKKEEVCQQIEEYWEEECYGDVEDFFNVTKTGEYKIVKESLRSLEVEEVIELSENERALLPTLQLAVFALVKARNVTTPSESCHKNLMGE